MDEVEVKNNLLLQAVEIDDTVGVNAALDSGADINTLTTFGCTPLTYAVIKRKFHIAQQLLDRGADPNCRGEICVTPLSSATRNGAPESLLRLLVEKGANIGETARDGSSPLRSAVSVGRRDVLCFFLLRGGVPQRDAAQLLFEVVIESSSAPSFMPVLQLLIGYSITPTQPSTITTINSPTDEQKKYWSPSSQLMRLINGRKDSDDDGRGDTVLMRALKRGASKGLAEVAGFLLDCLASTHMSDHRGAAPLQVCGHELSPLPHVAVVLLQHSASECCVP